MDDTERAGRRRGRPRSTAVDAALLQAAVDEFTANGFRDMSMESIATRAGVSKVSLYRRWTSKIAVTEEILRLMSQTTTPTDQGSLEADVRHLIGQSVGTPQAMTTARVLMRTMGEISGDPKLLALYREHLLRPRIEQIHTLIERARRRGEIHPNLDTDVIAMTIAGPVFLYQLSVLTNTDTDLPEDMPDQMIRAILVGISATRDC
ncbi:TetR/AcrR family transcriptional regulator [Mycobacterium sp. MUNTM1]